MKRVKPAGWSRGAVILVVSAGVLAVLPIPPQIVERAFSRGLYAAIQPAVTFASNVAPFAWLDVMIAAVAASLVTLTVRDTLRSGAWSAAKRGAWRMVVWAAALYLVFLMLWGFNYRRQRLTQRVAFEPSAVTPAAARRLASVAVDRINALHAAAHAEGWVSGSAIDPALAGSFDSVARDLGALPRGIVVGRPKRSLLDWYFQRAGVAGMTDPWFLETLVAGDLLPFERPHVVAHEWAHLAGLADEGEANVAGWLACLRGSSADQYSGWLFMYGESVPALPPRERAALIQRVGGGPRADLDAIRERTLRHVNPRLSSAGWRVYDSYLKANRVEAGVQSYTDVVRLALGLDAARAFR
jgi:hypothetical protein